MAVASSSGSPEMSVPGQGALHQEDSAFAVTAQKPRGAVTVPELEGVAVLVGVVILRRHHLQHRVVPGGRDVRVAGEGERRPELDPPPPRHRLSGLLERRQIRTGAHGRRLVPHQGLDAALLQER